MNIGKTGWPIIVDDDDPRAKQWEKKRQRPAAPQQPSVDISPPDTKRESELEREYRAKRKFTPNPSWFCLTCRFQINKKPLAECPADSHHRQWYQSKHPNSKPACANTAKTET